MAIYLEINSNEMPGVKHLIFEGITLGRGKADITIPDPKISSIHAKVEKETSGQLVLVDQNSSNGLYLNGQRVKRILLADGVRFQVGKTFFRVISMEAQMQGLPAIPWKEELDQLINGLVMEDAPEPFAILPIIPALQFEFLEGPQAGKTIYLGYGPRVAGAESLDINIQEPQIPNRAFQIQVQSNGEAQFQSLDPSFVRINNNQAFADKLKTGDLIQVGSTIIRVTVLDK